jgi:hypothetical protein
MGQLLKEIAYYTVGTIFLPFMILSAVVCPRYMKLKQSKSGFRRFLFYALTPLTGPLIGISWVGGHYWDGFM